jgi:hypothetical protein
MTCVLLICVLLGAAETWGQDAALRITNVSGDWIAASTPLVLQVNRPLLDGERIAVLLGTRDITPQLTRAGLSFRFSNRGVRVPSGEYTLTTYLVLSDTAWRELLRQQVHVEGALGVRERKLTPALDIGLKSRFRTNALPPPNGLDRLTYHDVDGQLALDAEATGRDFRIGTRASILGTTHRPSALRFGQRQDAAPLLDLASYLIQYSVGGAQLSLGQLTSGSQRHLIDNFASRGAGMRITRGRVSASLDALHGSNLVGWDDALGFTDPDHRIITTALALEALPAAGALRIELTTLNGSLKPVSGFTQGAVTDAERSDGHGVRITSALLGQRLRVEAGLARSRFEQRPDPLLGAADSLVPVSRETRQARYLDAAAELVRWGSAAATGSLALGYAHERIDPLYRSAGAYVQSDRVQDRVNARLLLRGLSLGVQHDRGRNNVDDVPSILTTRTRRSGADLNAPLASMFGMPSRWLPTVSFSFARTQQRGLSLPSDGGFDPSHIPDQISDDGTASLSWQGPLGSVALQGNRSAQDNRQPGRERADLRSSTLGARTLATVHRLLSVSADVAWTTARNLERDESERTTRFAIGPTLNPGGPVTLQLQYATTATRNRASKTRRDDTQSTVQLAAPLPRPMLRVGSWFLRYARQANDTADPAVQVQQRLRHWTIDGGITLTLR